MRQRLYSLAPLATLLPVAFIVVSLVLSSVGLAEPCPGPGSGGC